MTEPKAHPKTYTENLEILTDTIDALRTEVKDVNVRVRALEDALKTGKGYTVGALAVLGFFILDGLSRLKDFLGVHTP